LSARVLFVAPSAYLLSGLAGWLDYLLPGLERCGWKPVLGLVEGAQFHLPDAYLKAHPCECAMAIACHTATPLGRQSAIRKAIRSCQAELVLSVNIPDVFPAMAGLCRQRKAPACAMTLHGISPCLDADARRYAAVLDGVIASNRLACALAAASVPSDRVYYAPYGVAVPVEPPPVARPNPHTYLEVLYAGRLDQAQKRVRDIPAVAAALVRRGVAARFRFAGDGPERESLAAAMALVPEPVETVFLGSLSPRMLQDEYRRASALLVTSEWETGPIVAWEAMATGLPVVISRYTGSGLEAALEDGRNCLQFAVGDAEGAAACLARLATDRSLTETLGAAGRQRVRERYTQEVSVRKWSDAFDRILARPTRRTPWPQPGWCDRVKENVRVLLGRRWMAEEPGGEWPFTHSRGAVMLEDAFMRTARRMDGFKEEVL
jgi:glycosyltransferase involved in cell wall biosynthesis